MASDVGHARLPTVAGPVAVEWSLDALAGLNRFAAFLHDQFPELAAGVSAELLARPEVLRRHPQLGRPLGHRHEYREIVLTVLGGTYALQYCYDGSSVLMLRSSTAASVGRRRTPPPGRTKPVQATEPISYFGSAKIRLTTKPLDSVVCGFVQRGGPMSVWHGVGFGSWTVRDSSGCESRFTPDIRPFGALPSHPADVESVSDALGSYGAKATTARTRSR